MVLLDAARIQPNFQPFSPCPLHIFLILRSTRWQTISSRHARMMAVSPSVVIHVCFRPLLNRHHLWARDVPELIISWRLSPPRIVSVTVVFVAADFLWCSVILALIHSLPSCIVADAFSSTGLVGSACISCFLFRPRRCRVWWWNLAFVAVIGLLGWRL